jgi:hypothetical protein
MLLHGVKGQKHKITKTLPNDPMVVNLMLLIHLVNVVDDPIKAIPTKCVFLEQTRKHTVSKTADSFLNGTITTLQHTLLCNLSSKINLIGPLSKKLKNVILLFKKRLGIFRAAMNMNSVHCSL